MDGVGGIDTQFREGYFSYGWYGKVGTRVRYHYRRIRIGRYPG